VHLDLVHSRISAAAQHAKSSYVLVITVYDSVATVIKGTAKIVRQYRCARSANVMLVTTVHTSVKETARLRYAGIAFQYVENAGKQSVMTVPRLTQIYYIP
jgi:hypothetical protein